MHRHRGVGFVFIILGIVYLTRSLQPATSSRVGVFAGCLMIAVGLIRAVWPRRQPSA